MAMPREVKVGLFVALGLAMAGLVVFLIGDEKSLFKPKRSFHALFDDVEGLKRGSPVRMGGIDVGAISGIKYGDDPADAKLHVTIEVNVNEAARVREGSTVSIEAKGLLGDKMLVVAVGDPAKPPLASGATLPVAKAGGVTELLGRASSIGSKVEGVVDNLERTTSTLADEQLGKDLRGAVGALNAVLGKLDRGEGYAGRLLTDPEEAQRISRTLANLEQTSAELARAARGVNQIVVRVNTGPGFAHEVIYGESSAGALAQFGGAAGELALTLRGIREGDSVTHDLLYGGDGSGRITDDLAAVSRDLRAIVAGVRAGRGTIGALLVDPSVYEDLKLLFGNVERNRVLRALVRYSIKRDEQVRRVEVKDPEPPPAPPASGSPAAAKR